MMDYSSIILALLSGGLGAISATLLAIYFTQLAAKKTLTLELHREFSSPQFYASRNLGENLIKKNPGKNLSHWHAELTSEKYAESFLILGFFERLAHCYELKVIDRKLASNLFGERFMFWYYLMERAGLFEGDWGYAEPWTKLKDHFSSSQHFTLWVEKASSQRR